MNKIGLLALFVACGDITTALGTEGRLTYGLYTHYNTLETDLGESTIVTGYAQRLDIALTRKGHGDVDAPDRIEHSISPASGVTLEVTDDVDVPDVVLKVSTPGTYTLTSIAEGDLVDEIVLTFAAPTELTLIAWARAPGSDTFAKLPENEANVSIGTQLTFLPVPTAGGQRLAGDVDIDLALSDASMAVLGMNVHGVYEQSVYTSATPTTLYCTGAGTLAVTAADRVYGVSRVMELIVD
jgi:hypothetical protein